MSFEFLVFNKANIVGEKLKEMAEIDEKYFPFPWGKHQWIKLEFKNHLVFTFQMNQKIVSFALFSIDMVDQSSHLLKILLLPELRGRGIAKQLMTKSIELLEAEGINSVYLEVASSNEKAINLYKSLDFKVLVRKKSYYSNGEDAFAMQRVSK